MDAQNSTIETDQKAGERAAYIAGLREMADFFDRHQELPTPSVDLTSRHLVYLSTKGALAAIARTPGVRWKKDWSNDDYFSLKAEFPGGHSYEVFVNRAQVCRKVVTGTRFKPASPAQQVEIVEWVCEDASLLADDNPRSKGDDDGVEYGDPRDARAERRS